MPIDPQYIEEDTTFEPIVDVNKHPHFPKYIENPTKPYDKYAYLFLRKFKEGDEWYSYSWYRGPFAAEYGVCIVRDGKPICYFMLGMS